MSRTQIIVGPEDHGTRMALEDFDRAEPREGHLYELGRGVIIVSDVPGKKHLKQVSELNKQLYLYQAANPEVIRMIGGGGECKILLPGFQSERHPDIFVYKTDPPDTPDIWSVWIPELVVEVVSPDSENRDYNEKPAEYLAFGVLEYWILDAEKQQATIHQRSGGRWNTKVLQPNDAHQTRLLPGFTLTCAPIFAAANQP